MISLPQHPECRACRLGQGSYIRNVGMATTPEPRNSRDKDRALIVMAGWPGYEEDKAGEHLCGMIGKMWKSMLDAAGFINHADLYYTNAVRCGASTGSEVSHGCVKACGPHFHKDVEILLQHYKEVIVLACGEHAIRQVLGEGTPVGHFPQGKIINLPTGIVRVFGTNNPGILRPGHDPSALMGMRAHLLMLRGYLEKGKLVQQLHLEGIPLVGPEVPDPPGNVPYMAMDIETYGAIEGLPNQTMFHPRKMEYWDKISPKDIVRTVNLAWPTPAGGWGVKVYRYQREDERESLFRVLANQHTILNFNVVFDVQVLRYVDPRWRDILNQKRVKLWELGVVSHLENDKRVERNLKSLLTVLGVTSYFNDKVQLRKGDKFLSDDDPDLHFYGAKDAVGTLLGYELLVDMITESYGPHSAKWKPECREWYNRTLWGILRMSENGVAMSDPHLREVHDRHITRCQVMLDEFPFAGKGSDKHLRSRMEEVIAGITPTLGPKVLQEFGRAVSRTKTGKIPTGEAVIQYLLDFTVRENDRKWLEDLISYRESAKTVSTYTSRLLGILPEAKPPRMIKHKPCKGKGCGDCQEGKVPQQTKAKKTKTKDYRGQALIDGIVYPSWYPIPIEQESGISGGTPQIRLSAKEPAIQTFPKDVKAAWCSRFPGGRLFAADMSQLELRTAAMVSGEPYFLSCFRENRSIHAEGAALIAGRPVDKEKDPDTYHMGKQINFRLTYDDDCSPWAYRGHVLKEGGRLLSIEDCERHINLFNHRCKTLRGHQARRQAFAQKNGYIEIPIIGISRTFIGPNVKESYGSIINNLEGQAIAFALTWDAQLTVMNWAEENLPGVLICMNEHDMMMFDCPDLESWEKMKEYALGICSNPPIYQRFIDSGYHECPLKAEVKE